MGKHARDSGKRKRGVSSVSYLPDVPCALPFFPSSRKAKEASVEDKLRSKQDERNFRACFSYAVTRLTARSDKIFRSFVRYGELCKLV